MLHTLRKRLEAGRLAALLGAAKIEEHGTQNHRFDLQEIKDRFKDNFDYALD